MKLQLLSLFKAFVSLRRIREHETENLAKYHQHPVALNPISFVCSFSFSFHSKRKLRMREHYFM